MKLFSRRHVFSDLEILEALKKDGRESENMLFYLNKRFLYKVRIGMAEHRLEEHDALEAYGEALMALRNQLRAEKFEGNSNLDTFFSRIFRNKCIDKFRRNATMIKIPDLESPETEKSPEQYLIDLEEADVEMRRDALRKYCLDRVMETFSKRDQAIMTEYFINEVKPKTLVLEFGLKNERSAASTAYTLKQNLKKAIADLCEKEKRCNILCHGAKP